MKKILFPTDFSQSAFHAYKFALSWANELGASVTTLHVFMPSIAQPFILEPFSLEMAEMKTFDEYKSAAHKMHEQAANTELESVEVSHLMEQGFPIETIVRVAKEENFDMIIMGTDGATGLAEIILGSTASQVIEKAHCPVLVVPKEAEFKSINKVLLPVDFFSIKPQILEKVKSMGTIMDAKVKCLHINNSNNPLLEKRIADLKSEYPGIEFEYSNFSYVIDGILDYVEKHSDIDLIFMVTEKYSILKNIFQLSYTKRTAIHTKIPVLAVR